MEVSLNGGTPQSPPQVLIIFSRSFPMVVGETHHFRKPLCIAWCLPAHCSTVFWNPSLVMMAAPSSAASSEVTASCLKRFRVITKTPKSPTTTIDLISHFWSTMRILLKTLEFLVQNMILQSILGLIFFRNHDTSSGFPPIFDPIFSMLRHLCLLLCTPCRCHLRFLLRFFQS